MLPQQSAKPGSAPTASEGRYKSWKELDNAGECAWKFLKTKTNDIMHKCSRSGKSSPRDVPFSYAWKVTSKVNLMFATE